MKRENDHIWTAAEETNREFGQWVPQRWLEIFIGKIATPLPLPSVDELKKIIAEHLDINTFEKNDDGSIVVDRAGIILTASEDNRLTLLGGSAR